VRRTAAALLVVLLAAASAAAHSRSISYSTWRQTERGADVSVRLALLDLSRLAFGEQSGADPDAPVGPYLTERLRLLAGDTPCAAGEPRRKPAPSGWAVWEWSVTCESNVPRTIESSLLLDVAPSHLHFARLDEPDGGVEERVLAEAAPRWPLADGGAAGGPTEGTSFGGYLALGVEHILSGTDHLAFVLALLLLAGTLSEVATLVTSFTVAHSVTLGLAVLGVVRPEGAAVEALIGYSIALVAAENVWLVAGRDRIIPVVVTGGLLLLVVPALRGVGALDPLTVVGLAIFSGCHFALLRRNPHPERLRAAVAFAFGLVHGFGFAGILTELELPASRLVPALVGFNLGVEVGQLAVVALAWPLLRLLATRGDGRWARLVAEGGSAAICGLGLYWLVERAFG
jgi:hypothetical protein